MPAKTDTKTISIPQLRTARLRVRVEGITPLISHRFSESAQRTIEAAQQGTARTKKPPREPQREFEESVYHSPDGRPAFPAIAFKLAAVRAGQRFGGERSTELLGAFSITTELVEIEGSAPAMRSDRVVLSGPSKLSSIAYRAQYMPWEATIPLLVNVDFLSVEQLVNLFRLGGFSVGVGDWRPERRGSFGQFSVIGVEALAADNAA